MKEKVYCPNCDKDDVTTNAVQLGREHSGFVSFLLWIFGGLIASLIYDVLYPGEYCQVTHHCRNCGYDFYELESNRTELYTAKKALQKTITTSVVLVLLGALFCFVSALFVGILFAAIGLLLLIRVPFLCRKIRVLKIMLEALEDCLERHETPETEAPTTFDQNRIPAWKRAQMEAEGK